MYKIFNCANIYFLFIQFRATCNILNRELFASAAYFLYHQRHPRHDVSGQKRTIALDY